MSYEGDFLGVVLHKHPVINTLHSSGCSGGREGTPIVDKVGYGDGASLDTGFDFHADCSLRVVLTTASVGAVARRVNRTAATVPGFCFVSPFLLHLS